VKQLGNLLASGGIEEKPLLRAYGMMHWEAGTRAFVATKKGFKVKGDTEDHPFVSDTHIS